MNATTTTNVRTATQAERRKARAVGISAAVVMVMLVFAVTFTTLSLAAPGGDVGGPDRDHEVGGPTPIVMVAPVATQFSILKPFCDVDIQYNATLRQWRSHRAIAIGAPEGTAVVATYAGTIESVRNTIYGTEVTINHGNGLQTVLRSLDRNTNVSQGDRVERGQRIGTVGTTSTVEFTNTPHVRLEVLRNGRRIDPATYIDFGDK